MTAIKKLRKRRAVSPVIATVILVAVTIMVAVAVSYWMSGIAGQYTSFEKVEIQSAYATWDGTNTWTITLQLKNTGSAEAMLISAFVNDKPVPEGYAVLVGETVKNYITCTEIDPKATTPKALLIKSGESKTVHLIIEIDPGTTERDPVHTFTSGTTLNIKLHSAGGMDYIKLVRLT